MNEGQTTSPNLSAAQIVARLVGTALTVASLTASADVLASRAFARVGASATAVDDGTENYTFFGRRNGTNDPYLVALSTNEGGAATISFGGRSNGGAVTRWGYFTGGQFVVVADPGGSEAIRTTGGARFGAGVTCTTLTASGECAVNGSAVGGMGLTLNGTMRMRNLAASRYRSDWAISAAGMASNAYDDTGAVYLPYSFSGSEFALAINGSATNRLYLTSTAPGTPAATEVRIGAGKIRCGDTSATSIQTAGGITASGTARVYQGLVVSGSASLANASQLGIVQANTNDSRLIAYGGNAATVGAYTFYASSSDESIVTLCASLSSTGLVVGPSDPGGSDRVRVSGGVSCTGNAHIGAGTSAEISVVGRAISCYNAGSADGTLVAVNDAGSATCMSYGISGTSTAKVGFLGAAAVARPTVTGSRGGNAALASALTALASLGLITDSTTA